MKILDVLIALVVLLIVGTVGYGVYATVINPPKAEPTTPSPLVTGAIVDYEAKNCPISMEYPNTWGANEQDGTKEIVVMSKSYKVIINCDAEEKKGDIALSSFIIDDITIDDEDFIRYIFFSDELSTEFINGYVVPNDKNLTTVEGAGSKYTGDLFINLNSVKYLITYDFGDGKRATSDEGAASFEKYLTEMDNIVKSIKPE